VSRAKQVSSDEMRRAQKRWLARPDQGADAVRYGCLRESMEIQYVALTGY
jgi:hypothetical protein